MITAKKSRLFSSIFYRYQSCYLLKRHFSKLLMKGEFDHHSSLPVLYIANHCSWWDGLLIFQLAQQYSVNEQYMMMDEEGLKTYPFFRKLGAFSVDRKKGSDIRKSMKYAESRLKDKHNMWLFPQGEIVHQEQRPLMFESGAGFLINRFDEVAVKPVSIYYSFSQLQKPIASLVFGEAIHIKGKQMDRGALTIQLASILEAQMNAHRETAIADIDFSQHDSFVSAFKQGKSTSDLYNDWIRGGKT